MAILFSLIAEIICIIKQVDPDLIEPAAIPMLSASEDKILLSFPCLPSRHVQDRLCETRKHSHLDGY